MGGSRSHNSYPFIQVEGDHRTVTPNSEGRGYHITVTPNSGGRGRDHRKTKGVGKEETKTARSDHITTKREFPSGKPDI